MVIAKGQITITELEDGFYTVRLAPSAIIIPANADGSNPVLTSAKARLFVSKDGGNTPVTINSASGVGCTVTWSGNEITITAISQGVSDGRVVIDFTTEDGYNSTTEITFLVSKQGESGITIVLDNETHALPASFDGVVSPAALDTARTKISVFRGATELTAVAANAVPGKGQFRYNVDSVTGGTATRIDNSNVKLATMTADQAIIRLNIYAESLENAYTKQMTIVKVREGKEGEKGAKGALPLFRGEYNKDEYGNTEIRTYTGNANRSDIVMHNGQYYFAKETAGVFNNISPTDPGQSKWEPFGSEVSSIATGLLLAQRAYIENLVVRNIITAGEFGEEGFRRFELTSANAPTDPNRFAFLAPYSDYYTALTGDVALMESKDNIAQDPNNGNKNIAGMRFQRPMANKNNDQVRVSGLGVYSNASGVEAIIPTSGNSAFGAVVGYLRRKESIPYANINASIVGLLSTGLTDPNCYAAYFNGKIRLDGEIFVGNHVRKGMTRTLRYSLGGTEYEMVFVNGFLVDQYQV